MVFTIQVARSQLWCRKQRGAGACLDTGTRASSQVWCWRESARHLQRGTMRVTEQIDALYMLKLDPIDYLVIPVCLLCCQF